MWSLSGSSAAAGLALAALSVLGTGSPAFAQEAAASCAYGQTCPTAISDSTPVPGQLLTVSSGSGTFDAGSRVTVTVFGGSFSVTAGAAGSASASFTVPTGQRAGRYSAVFTGTLAGAASRVGVPFTVVDVVTSTTSAGQLPRTGSNLLPIGAAGLALVGVGAAFVVVAARTRRRT